MPNKLWLWEWSDRVESKEQRTESWDILDFLSCTKSFIVMLENLSHWKNFGVFFLIDEIWVVPWWARKSRKGTVWKALMWSAVWLPCLTATHPFLSACKEYLCGCVLTIWPLFIVLCNESICSSLSRDDRNCEQAGIKKASSTLLALLCIGGNEGRKSNLLQWQMNKLQSDFELLNLWIVFFSSKAELHPSIEGKSAVSSCLSNWHRSNVLMMQFEILHKPKMQTRKVDLY